MSADNTAIRVENLSVRFEGREGEVRALEDVSLQVRAGERVAVIGPSGGGKSTLIRVLAGLVAPSEGTVEVAGRRLDGPESVPRSHYRDVGLVFQNHGLVPPLSALKNVLFGRLYDYGATGPMRFGEDDRIRARRHLKHLGLADRIEAPVSHLSGGERQRVALCRLLLQRPSVALLDEPLSSLDIHWARCALDALDELGGEESAAVMVLHDLDLARRWADRVIYLEDGRIISEGEPDAMCTRFEDAVGPTGDARGANGELESSDDAAAASLTSGEPIIADEPPGPKPGESPDETPGLRSKTFYALIAAALVAAYVWAARGVEFSATEIFANIDDAVDFVGRMLPPDISEGVTQPVFDSLVETIQMALIGTTMAAIVSLPIAVMAARNVSPKPLRAVARVVLNLLRTIPSIIWGLFFVAIVGLGPFPGILALTFYAAGYLGKFYYEGIESIDTKPLVALKTVGAGRIHRFRYGVVPQVTPLLLGYTLYMFEYNVRSASILGIVGAGGIGFYLYTYINNFNYAKATTALLMLLVVVTIIDWLSSYLREKLSESH
ncbi:MAG: phosphonate ABC transporter, permease protein PhnE [Persicimonas sp.]